ncbi:Zinc finger SWIM domain-containing protein 8 [Sarcoptes scabiei]|uniref:Zinc finger SWIM domain-containing protein 8 n=1 Tax=Sarcoptes scabiei TaxID=52283 RepID=A0A834R6G6_SARSC|nr:Zinc finger SWIM domain-containing protein 8 [Sarcoptes scabiei]
MTDVFSFGDSSPAEQFDDDSWMSEPESICNNWRGWKKTPNGSNNEHRTTNSQNETLSNAGNFFVDGVSSNTVPAEPIVSVRNRNDRLSDFNNASLSNQSSSSLQNENNLSSKSNAQLLNLLLDSSESGKIPSLTELTARVVARHISFEVVERVCSPVPEQLQLLIAYWSFPDNEEDIRLYSCLANGSADEFQKGESFYQCQSVDGPLQIGFHLSATVSALSKTFTVAVTFDRRRITSCNCTCASPSSWCSHVVAVCLHRIYQPRSIRLRAPVSESLSRLTRDQLQKFAQYLISESPQQILPSAQRLLDDLLMNENSDINKVRGAPDPTAGAPANEQTKWCLDEIQLHENIRKIVIKLCIPSPMVYSDVNYLSSTAPPAAAEWTSLLRPLRGREPEGLWNLLSIVREMLRRHDRNAIPLLRILTEELLACDQIVIWWFFSNVSLQRGFSNTAQTNNTNGGSNNRSIHSNIYAPQHACCSLCDEIVVLWRLVTLNPAHSKKDTKTLFEQLKEYHLKILTVIYRFKPSTSIASIQSTSKSNTTDNSLLNGEFKKQNDLEIFSGFKPAMVSCLIDWDNYPISGITHQNNNHIFYESSLHEQLNSVNHAISSTLISLRIDPEVLWNSKRNQSYYDNENIERFNEPTKNVNEEIKKRSSIHDSNRSKDDDSEDSGNNDIWDSYFEEPSDDENLFNKNSVIDKKTEEGPRDRKESFSNVSTQNEHRIESEKEISSANEESTQENSANLDEDYKIYIYNEDVEKVKHVNKSNDENLQYEPCLLSASIVKPLKDPFEISFARAEALYAHGHVAQACSLAIQLAVELLNNPPDFRIDVVSNDPQSNFTSNSSAINSRSSSYSKRTTRNRFNPTLHRISLSASTLLSRTSFICQVLSENEDSHLLAFKVGLFGLELVRPPASTKVLEVKLAHQEQELANMLRRIPLCPVALNVLREKARNLRDGLLTTRGDALLPLSLASYIFEAFITSNQIPSQLREPTDEHLVFSAVVETIGLKAKISEAEHPLLCEGTRRQRGDLALNLLLHYKDQKKRLDLIMEKLLSKDTHHIFNVSNLNLNPNQTSNNVKIDTPYNSVYQNPSAEGLVSNFNNLSIENTVSQQIKSVNSDKPAEQSNENDLSSNTKLIAGQSESNLENTNSEISASSSDSFDSIQIAKKSTANCSRSNNDLTTTELTIDDDFDTIKSNARHQNVQSKTDDCKNDDDTKQSVKHLHPGLTKTSTNSNSYCNYINVFNSNSPMQLPYQINNPNNLSSNYKTSRFKGKRHYPIFPNQPSEASAHFMFELAKTLLAKAGGNNTTVLFTQPPTSQSCRPHRLLHMCSFQIGLYALGLHNAVSPNWLSRTYSSHVSWIICQAMEIGCQAIEFLIDTWEGHLTPSEAAALADRASRSQENSMIKAASQLALSCLPHAHALTPSEIQRALCQCKEQSSEMLERACLVVEQAGQGGGVYPEVLFDVARKWYQLYLKEKVDEFLPNDLPQFHNSKTEETEASEMFSAKDQSKVTEEKQSLSDIERSHATIPNINLNAHIVGQFDNGHIFSGQTDSPFYSSILSSPINGIFHSDLNQILMLQHQANPTNHSLQTQNIFYTPRPYIGNAVPNARYVQCRNYNAIELNRSFYSANQTLNSYSNVTDFNQPGSSMVQTSRPSFIGQYYAPIPGSSNSFISTPPSLLNNTLITPQPNVPTIYAYDNNLYFQSNNGLRQTSANSNIAIPMSPYSYLSMRPSIGLMASQRQLRFYSVDSFGAKVPSDGNNTVNVKKENDLNNYQSDSNQSQNHCHNIQTNTTMNIISGPKQLNYMHAAYRVGMLAMDTLARRNHDERPQVKYAKTPSYGEDVKWLLYITKKLGSHYVQEFCLCALTAITSPFVLYEIILEASQSIYQSASNNSPYLQSIRSQIMTPLIQKCQQMFASCIYFQIMHITSSDYEEFISTLREARIAYQLLPGGNLMFNELLQSLKRTKTCKKGLWQQITAAMQRNESH